VEWIITPEELKEELKQRRDQVVLVDVREPEEFAESRIEGGKLIPLGELSARAPGELKDLDADIVLYCAHGVRSLQGLMALRMLGYTRLRSLEGGIEAWRQATASS
jgi:rhodanese-related sulfurtransferase